MATKKIVIIGGGFTGLTAAWALAKSSVDVDITILERAPVLGGLAAGFPICATTLEKTYHYLFLTDSAILGLTQELGLEQQVIWCDSTIGVSLGGNIYPFSTPLDLLRFRPCGFLNRLRLGLVVLYLKHRKNWEKFAGQRAHQWMSKACGRTATEAVWTPLLKGKFDRYFDSVSMAWLWARIHTRANSRGPGGGKEQLGYFRGGFGEVVSRLESELIRRNVRIQTHASVEEFGANERTVRVNGRWLPFDACIFTGASSTLASLLPPDPKLAGYAQKLRSVEYLGAICLVFASDQDIAGQFWLNIHDKDAPFLLFVQHTRLVGTELYQGKHIYYIGCYQPQDSALFTINDETLTVKWFDYLRKIYPHFDVNRVSERHLFKFRTAQHIVDTRYQEKIPDYRTPLPGLYLANFSQIYPEDRGTNFAVREGNKIADLVLSDLKHQNSSPPHDH